MFTDVSNVEHLIVQTKLFCIFKPTNARKILGNKTLIDAIKYSETKMIVFIRLLNDRDFAEPYYLLIYCILVIKCGKLNNVFTKHFKLLCFALCIA